VEAFARQNLRQLRRRMYEEEVEGVIGRARYERRWPVDTVVGYCNGFGKPRRLSLGNKTITLRRERGRGFQEQFESRLLPAFKRRTEEGGRPCPSYTCTAWPRATSATGPLSAPAIAHLNAGGQAEYEPWRIRSVADLAAVHLRVDGVYVNPDSRDTRPRSSSSWRRCAPGRR